jgi:hypothetical protein
MQLEQYVCFSPPPTPPRRQDNFEGIVATHIPELKITNFLWGFLKKVFAELNQEAYNCIIMTETRLSLDAWSSGLMQEL